MRRPPDDIDIQSYSDIEQPLHWSVVISSKSAGFRFVGETLNGNYSQAVQQCRNKLLNWVMDGKQVELENTN